MSRRHTDLARAARISLLLLAVACGGDGATVEPNSTPSGPRVASVLVTEALDSIVIGQSGRIVAVALDQAGRPISTQPVIWSGSNPAILSVSADGVILGIANGAAVASATADGRSVSVSIVVRTIAASIEILPRQVVLAPAATHPLAVVVRDAKGAAFSAHVSFSSADSSIATVDAAGRVTAVRPGLTEVIARSGGVTRSLAVRVDPAAAGDFAIAVDLVGDAASVATAARAAATRWERVIGGDLVDVELAIPAGVCGFGIPALHRTVDDVAIVVRLDTLDGPGGTIASAGPCVARQESRLPALGVIRLDVEDLASLRALGALETVLAHEIGHVLGLGTTWRESGRTLMSDAAGASGYVGEHARRAASWLGFTSAESAPVPVENEGDAGTRGMHWRESVFARELMTGWLDEEAPLSAVTVGALRDLGYAVRESGADAFSSIIAVQSSSRLAALFGNDESKRMHDHVIEPTIWVR
jgi:hypothetical protein